MPNTDDAPSLGDILSDAITRNERNLAHERQEAYINAIRAIADSSYSSYEVAIALAQKDPVLFLELIKKDQPEPVWMKIVADYLRRGQKIEAIKAYRTCTGAGLKESKDAVEAYAEKHSIYMASSY